LHGPIRRTEEKKGGEDSEKVLDIGIKEWVGERREKKKKGESDRNLRKV